MAQPPHLNRRGTRLLGTEHSAATRRARSHYLRHLARAGDRAQDSSAKRHRVGYQHDRPERDSRLREVLSRDARDPRKTRDWLQGRPIVRGDDGAALKALKDVAIQVERGQTLGTVGPSRADESPLLKTISRITAPTKGRVIPRGPIASPLAARPGLHPELTGRKKRPAPFPRVPLVPRLRRANALAPLQRCQSATRHGSVTTCCHAGVWERGVSPHA